MLRRTLTLTIAAFVALSAMIVPQWSAQAFQCGVRVHTAQGDYCICYIIENGRPIRIITDCD